MVNIEADEHREKLSSAKKGKKPWNKGMLTPMAVKEKQSKSRLKYLEKDVLSD